LKTVTVRACSNIAFIKYWGNRDHDLRLPDNGSLSMNLNGIHTETSVRWDDALSSDIVTVNGQSALSGALQRVQNHLNHIRLRLNLQTYAYVDSANNFPMGAGIASSASAFAALTVAAVASAEVDVSERELTTLARLGSGSAARSVPDGFVEWYAGNSHESSFAESIAGSDHWNLVDVIAIVSVGHKDVGSTQGHHSADTSELQSARVAGATKRLEICRQAILERDFSTFVEVVEHDSNLMHAIMMTSRPPLFYWLPSTLAIMNRVRSLRHDGLSVCYTLDAGPNVHCICLQKDSLEIVQALTSMEGVVEVRIAAPGKGVQFVDSSVDM
jgi:diphosphomevalonate decarboxylase